MEKAVMECLSCLYDFTLSQCVNKIPKDNIYYITYDHEDCTDKNYIYTSKRYSLTEVIDFLNQEKRKIFKCNFEYLATTCMYSFILLHIELRCKESDELPLLYQRVRLPFISNQNQSKFDLNFSYSKLERIKLFLFSLIIKFQ